MPEILDNVAALRERQTAYKLAFNSPAGHAVLSDLVKFCRANATCFHKDARIHAALEGRREVFLRIVENLNLSLEQLLSLYQGRLVAIEEQENE